ncbi:MAG: hypothetical protein ACRD3J_18310 [Thermoanaerobaculia bacterium]
MAENDKMPDPGTVAPTAPDGSPPVPPKRSPGHRGADVKDTVAEMAAKAHEISLEAGSKMSAAMKDVVNAAAGLSGFVMESARDLVQFMVRRGQMTQEEADKLIRQVEEHQPKRKPVAPPIAPKGESAKHAATASSAGHAPKIATKPAVVHHPAPAKKAASKPAPAAKHAKPAKAAKPAKPAKKAAKPAPKKAAPKKTAPKKAAPKKAAAKKPAPKKAAHRK